MMEKFISHTGIAAPLRRSNVDTDQIIPAVYLKRVTKTGFEDGLFAAWRQDKDFVLNLAPFRKASILVAGPDFGTGSSRNTQSGRCGTTVLKWFWRPSSPIFSAVTAKKMAWWPGLLARKTARRSGKC